MWRARFAVRLGTETAIVSPLPTRQPLVWTVHSSTCYCTPSVGRCQGSFPPPAIETGFGKPGKGSTYGDDLSGRDYRPGTHGELAGRSTAGDDPGRGAVQPRRHVQRLSPDRARRRLRP